MLHYSALPYLIAFAALVFVFRSMLRRQAGEKLDSWLLGWTFLLLHFAAQFLDVGAGMWGTGIATISLLSLELAGIIFIRAASRFDLLAVEAPLLIIWAAALLGHSALAIWDVEQAAGYYIAVVILASSLSVINYRVRSKRSALDNVLSFSAGLLLPLMLAGFIPRHRTGYGIDTTLSWLYLVASLRYWQRFERKTTGVLTATFGFAAMAAAFPLGLLIRQTYSPDLTTDTAVRNIPKFIIAIGVLLTFLEEEIESTEHLALHDPLTGLPNLRLLKDRLGNMLERAERNHTRAAVLMVDLDGFKKINDTYGHAIGDEFLREAAWHMGSVVRKADTLARTGGDEFTVLVSDIMQPDGALILAKKIQDELDQPISVGDLQLHISGSIGVAVYPDDALTASGLCAMADAQMYRAKHHTKSASGLPFTEPGSITLPPG